MWYSPPLVLMFIMLTVAWILFFFLHLSSRCALLKLPLWYKFMRLMRLTQIFWFLSRANKNGGRLFSMLLFALHSRAHHALGKKTFSIRRHFILWFNFKCFPCFFASLQSVYWAMVINIIDHDLFSVYRPIYSIFTVPKSIMTN